MICDTSHTCAKSRRGTRRRRVGQGWRVSTRNAASTTRWTPPWSLVARPGTTVKTLTTDVRASSTMWVGSRPESQRAVEPDRGHRDRRDGQPDAGHGGPQRQVEADLGATASGRVVRGDRLGQQHEQGDDDPDDRLWQAERGHRVLDGRGLDLGQPDDGHQRDEEQPEADQGDAGRTGARRARPPRAGHPRRSRAGRSRDVGRSG